MIGIRTRQNLAPCYHDSHAEAVLHGLRCRKMRRRLFSVPMAGSKELGKTLATKLKLRNKIVDAIATEPNRSKLLAEIGDLAKYNRFAESAAIEIETRNTTPSAKADALLTKFSAWGVTVDEFLTACRTIELLSLVRDIEDALQLGPPAPAPTPSLPLSKPDPSVSPAAPVLPEQPAAAAEGKAAPLIAPKGGDSPSTSGLITVSTVDLDRGSAENEQRKAALTEQLCLIVTSAEAPKGSACLVGQRVLLTSAHVISPTATTVDQLRDAAEKLFVKLRNGKKIPLNNALFAASPPPAGLKSPSLDFLDYVFVGIDGEVDVSPAWLLVDEFELRCARVAEGDRLFIAHRPGGAALPRILESDPVTALDALRVTYAADTEPGSSGSPVSNPAGQIIALHRGGDNRGCIGILIHAILNDVLRKDRDFISVLLRDSSTLQPTLYPEKYIVIKGSGEAGLKKQVADIKREAPFVASRLLPLQAKDQLIAAALLLKQKIEIMNKVSQCAAGPIETSLAAAYKDNKIRAVISCAFDSALRQAFAAVSVPFFSASGETALFHNAVRDGKAAVLDANGGWPASGFLTVAKDVAEFYNNQRIALNLLRDMGEMPILVIDVTLSDVVILELLATLPSARVVWICTPNGELATAKKFLQDKDPARYNRHFTSDVAALIKSL